MASSRRKKHLGVKFHDLFHVFSLHGAQYMVHIFAHYDIKNHFHQDKNLWLHLMEKSWMNGEAKHSKQTHTKKIPNYIKMEKQKNVNWLDGKTLFMHIFFFMVLLAQDPHPNKLNKKCMWDNCYCHGYRGLHPNTKEVNTFTQFLH